MSGCTRIEEGSVHPCRTADKTHPPAMPVGSVWQMLRDRAHDQPDKTAIVGVDISTGEERAWSCTQLYADVVRCANYLYNQYNVHEHASLSFAYDNRAEVLVLSLAGALLGASSVPLDSRRDVVERMAYKLKLTEARVLITHPRGPHREAWARVVQQLRDRTSAPPIVEFTEECSLFDEIADCPSVPQFPVVADLDHVQVTLFTSGTTADPKGAQLTAANLLYDALAVGQWLGISEQDTLGVILPLHHINSTTFSLATLLAGGTLVLFSDPPREQFWELAAKYRVTITSIVQKIAYQLLEDRAQFESVRNQLVLSRIQIGSDVVDAVAAEQFVQQYGIPLYQGYGLTEVALRATGVPMGLPEEDYLSLVRRNTIGTPLAGVNVCILAQDSREAGPGEKGEICIRGPIVMKGYLRDARATAVALEGGWFHTGDLGWYEILFGRPFFFYHSRAKEIIKKGGALISPAAIDRAVRARFPELEDACSFGYPSKDWGEDIWMAVTFVPDTQAGRRQDVAEEIVSLGRQGRIPGLPRFEAPTCVIAWDTEFPGHPIPRTSTLKIQRARLQSAVLARFPPPDAG